MAPAPAGPWHVARAHGRRLGAAAMLLIGAALAAWPPVQAVDRQAYDLGLRLAAAWRTPAVAGPAVLIALDEASLQALPGPLALMHAELGLLFEALAAARPTAVGVDLVLPERSHDGLVPGSDERLLRGILDLRGGSVLVLARTVGADGVPRSIHRPFVAAAGPGGTGLALFRSDADGVVRRFTERLAVDGSAVPTLVGELARRTGVAAVDGLVDFSRAVPPVTLPLHEVLAWARAGDAARLAAVFGGRTVFVGASLPFEDRHRTPLQAADEAVPGVLIHLQMMQALQRGHLLRELPGWALALAGAVLAACGLAVRGALRAAGVVVAAAITLVALQAAALRGGWAVPVASAWAAFALAVLARLAVDSALELAQRRRLRAAFAGYVSPPVMKALEAGRLDGMASERRFIAVLFMDIRGFTARAEATPPETVVATLNTAFEAVTGVIHDHGGTVKEFMGDGVMALFGAPQPLPNAAQAAFDAGRAIVAALPAVNAALQSRGQPALRIGIGIACGHAVVGHVGALTRHAYGAVGDCVNVASRLEGATKELGRTMLLSDAVRQQLADAPGCVALGEVALKGHSTIVVHGWDPAAAAG